MPEIVTYLVFALTIITLYNKHCQYLLRNANAARLFHRLWPAGLDAFGGDAGCITHDWADRRRIRNLAASLTKVVQDLARGGFVTTRRGSGGGISLARSSDTIRLGSVVRHLERRFALVECCQKDGRICVLKPRCGLKPRLLAAHDEFLNELDRSTVTNCAWPGTVAAV